MIFSLFTLFCSAVCLVFSSSSTQAAWSCSSVALNIERLFNCFFLEATNAARRDKAASRCWQTCSEIIVRYAFKLCEYAFKLCDICIQVIWAMHSSYVGCEAKRVENRTPRARNVVRVSKGVRLSARTRFITILVCVDGWILVYEHWHKLFRAPTTFSWLRPPLWPFSRLSCIDV